MMKPRPIETEAAKKPAVVTEAKAKEKSQSISFVSDKIEDLNGAKNGDELIRGTASEHSFIFSHFVLGEAAPQRAVESAIKHGGENCLGLSEATITARFVWWLPLVYTHYSYTAEGKPIYRRQE